MNNNANDWVSTNDTIKTSNNDKKSGIILFISILIILILVISVILLINGSNKKKIKNNIEDTTFFIKDDDKYALFNINGEKLTDFIYEEASNFYNGTALVFNDNKYNIISNTGEVLVTLDDYNKIEDNGSFFVATKSNNQYILNRNGKVVLDLKNKSMDDINISGSHIMINLDKKLQIINNDGKVIVDISKQNKNDKIETKFYEYKDGDIDFNYITLFYNNKNYVLIDKNQNTELIGNFSGNEYCIKVSTEDGSKVIMAECENAKDNFKGIYNNKIYNIDKKCTAFTKINKNDLACIGNDGFEYLLNDNYKIGMDLSKAVYKNKNAYAVKNENGGVDFHYNGKVTTNNNVKLLFSRQIIINSYDDVYKSFEQDLEYNYKVSIGEGENNTKRMALYNLKGEQLKSLYPSDENGNYLVLENNLYYLYNENNQKISDGYYAIIFESNFYKAVSGTDRLNIKYGILDKNGKLVIPCEYSSVRISKKLNSNIATLMNEDIMTLYNIDLNKKIVTIDFDNYSNFDIANDKYILLTDNDMKTKYYSYLTGNLFYEKK